MRLGVLGLFGVRFDEEQSQVLSAQTFVFLSERMSGKESGCSSLLATKLDLLVPRIVCFEQLFETLMQTLGLSAAM